MKLKEAIRLASDNDTVHGLRQLHESESKAQRSLWGGYLLGAVVLFLCVVLPVTFKYIRNERLVEVELRIPDTFPTLSICPVRIPLSVAESAGYDSRALQKLESVINYQAWTDVNISKYQFGDEPVFAQEMLYNIAREHFKMLNITSTRSILNTLPLQQVEEIMLNPLGYCLRYKSPKLSSAFSTALARFMFNKVTIYNRALFEESGRLRIAVGHARDPVVLPGAGTFRSNLRLSARWLQTEVVKPSKRECSFTHHSLEHCYADCMANLACDNCELLSPFKNQTFDVLCKGRDVALCLQTSHNMIKCIHACKKPCMQSRNTISNIAETPNSETDLVIDMVIESPDASLSMYQVPFSTPSVYFAYVCNGLGVFLGVHLYALVALAQLCCG